MSVVAERRSSSVAVHVSSDSVKEEGIHVGHYLIWLGVVDEKVLDPFAADQVMFCFAKILFCWYSSWIGQILHLTSRPQQQKPCFCQFFSYWCTSWISKVVCSSLWKPEKEKPFFLRISRGTFSLCKRVSLIYFLTIKEHHGHDQRGSLHLAYFLMALFPFSLC